MREREGRPPADVRRGVAEILRPFRERSPLVTRRGLLGGRRRGGGEDEGGGHERRDHRFSIFRIAASARSASAGSAAAKARRAGTEAAAIGPRRPSASTAAMRTSTLS